MHAKYIFILLISFLITIFLITGCDRNVVFEENKKIENHEWHIDDTITFVSNIADTSQLYDILIQIRNGGMYEYSNLFLFIKVNAPSGNSITDTIEIPLADYKGKWYGRGLGDIKSLTIPYRKNVRFGLPGIYNFNITHGMRKNSLKEVFDIGIYIQNSVVMEEK